MIFKTKAREATLAPQAETRPDGRERLRFFADELVKANEAVAELEVRLDRLTGIIQDAELAQATLQQAIAEDGGVGLAEYAAGRAQDSDIAQLVQAKETTAKAAAAARDAVPNVQNMLSRARNEVARLEQQKQDEALRYLKQRADHVALQYKRIFDALCRSHDQLVGISAALSATGEHGGEIRMSSTPIQVPRFDLPSVADPNEFLPTMTHRPADIAVEDATANWLEARNRLSQDTEAKLDDLIGPANERNDDDDRAH